MKRSKIIGIMIALHIYIFVLYSYDQSKAINEPCREIMVRFVLRKLILLISHVQPVGQDVWFLVGPSAWAFAGRLCDKYHNSWF